MGHCPNPPVLLRPGLRHHTRRQDHLPLKVPPFHHTSTQAMPFACLSVSLNNAPPQSRTDRASFLKLRDGPSAPFLELRESKREDWGCLSSSSASSGLHCQTRECVMSSMTQCFHNPLLSDAVGSRRCRPALVGLKTARAGTRAAMTNEGGAAVVKASPRCWSCYVSSSIDQNDAHIRPALLNTCAYSFSCPPPPPVPAHRPSSPSSKRGKPPLASAATMSRTILTLCLLAGCVQGFQSSGFRPNFALARYVPSGRLWGWERVGGRRTTQARTTCPFVMLKCLRGA